MDTTANPANCPIAPVLGPVHISVLAENTAAGRGLLAEHGLSFWIEAGQQHILFDVGQTDVFARNARILGIDLSRTNAIVLSHGHYDHTGGLSKAMQLAPHTRVFLHPDALNPKFSRRNDGVCHDVGMPVLTKSDIRRRCADLILTDQPTQITDGVFVTGTIPRTNGFEDVGGPFYRDSGCTQPDPLLDDQALYFRCAKGIVVVLGCAHAGVINTLNYIRTLTGNAPIHAILGGMHLLSASEERLAATVDALQEHENVVLAPAHCTGTQQTMLLWYRYPGRCRKCQVGSRFVFE